MKKGKLRDTYFYVMTNFNYKEINFLIKCLTEQNQKPEKETDADTLNKIENKVRKGKATQREIFLLCESYMAFNVVMPKDIARLLK